MDEQAYLSERVDDQINWMGGKAAYNQKMFKRIRVIEVFCSASIPFLVAMSSDSALYLKWITGIFGVTITICESLLALYKYQELWLQYRSTTEALKSEKLKYLTKSGTYNKLTDPFKAFVEKVETILGQENIQWNQEVREIDRKKI